MRVIGIKSLFFVAPIIGVFSSFFPKNFWTSSLSEIKPSRLRKKRESQGGSTAIHYGPLSPPASFTTWMQGPRLDSPGRASWPHEYFLVSLESFNLILGEGTYPTCAQALLYRCQAHVIYCNGHSTGPHEMIFAAPLARACQPAPRRPSGFCCPLLKGPQIELTKKA